jgi:hypothetical protein
MRATRTQAESADTVKPVPRGAERAKKIAAAAAEARARILSAPNPFELLTPEERARHRASLEPEILGSGPQRKAR